MKSRRVENLDANRQSIPDRGNSQRKSPEAGPSLACLRNSKENSGSERMSKGEERNDVDGGIFRGWATQRKV